MNWLRDKKKALIIGIIVAAVCAVTAAPPAAVSLVIESIYAQFDKPPVEPVK